MKLQSKFLDLFIDLFHFILFFRPEADILNSKEEGSSCLD